MTSSAAVNQLAYADSGQKNPPVWLPLQGGGEIDISGNFWGAKGARKSISLNFELIPLAAKSLIPPLKQLFAWYLRNRSEATAMGAFFHIKHLLLYIAANTSEPIDEISDIHLMNYVSDLEAKDFWYLSSLSSALFNWHELGYHGVSKAAVKMLKERKKPGNKKGDDVRRMDVEKGPFSEIEFESLNISALNVFEDGRFDTKTFTLILLVFSHGARNVQLAHLKVKDIKRLAEVKYGSNYELSMPVAKNGEPPRQELRPFYLQNDFGALVFSYAQEIKQDFIGLLEDTDEAPLFPAKKHRQSKYEDVEGLEYHMNPTALGNWISSAAESLGVVSERTGEALNIFPTRFRRSFGTRLGAEGHPATVIAHMMCHHDIQNVLVYTGATWEAIDRIDRAVGMMLAPLVLAFIGTIVLDESEAIRGDDPSSRIYDPRITDSTEVMGSCGKYSFCGFNAPIACYTCRQFQPWLDGPHEAVFAHLMSERERLLSTDKRIAKVLDRTILAVLEVIRRCAEITGDFPSQDADHAS